MRLRLDSYPVVDEIAARYGDMDANAHLNNLALESMHENARATMNRDVLPEAYRPGARRLRLVTSQNAVHFLAEAHWPALIATGAGVGRIGRTSYVASTGLFLDGATASACATPSWCCSATTVPVAAARRAAHRSADPPARHAEIDMRAGHFPDPQPWC